LIANAVDPFGSSSPFFVSCFLLLDYCNHHPKYYYYCCWCCCCWWWCSTFLTDPVEWYSWTRSL